jgi:hypothetical protein
MTTPDTFRVAVLRANGSRQIVASAVSLDFAGVLKATLLTMDSTRDVSIEPDPPETSSPAPGT